MDLTNDGSEASGIRNGIEEIRIEISRIRTVISEGEGVASTNPERVSRNKKTILREKQKENDRYKIIINNVNSSINKMNQREKKKWLVILMKN
jgi:hypothetical protein